MYTHINWTLRLTFLLLIFVSCKKAENRKCWKFAGKKTSLIRSFSPSLKTLSISEHLEVELVQDSLNFLEIDSYENLINFISSKEENGTLLISNENKCSYLRRMNLLSKIRIHFTEFKNMQLITSENVRTIGKITQDSLTIRTSNGAGHTYVNCDLHYLRFECLFGYGSFEIEGDTHNADFFTQSGTFGNSEKLNIINYLSITTNGSSHLRIKAPNNLLLGTILSNQNSFCKGIPASNLVTANGIGKLIFE